MLCVVYVRMHTESEMAAQGNEKKRKVEAIKPRPGGALARK